MNILQVKKITICSKQNNRTRKVTYSPPLSEAFEKKIKKIKDQKEKQIKTLEEHGKQLVKYNDKKESKNIQNKKKFLKILLIKEWKESKI